MKEGVWGEQPKRQSGDGSDPMGMWLGLGVFLVGILILLFLFYRGFTEFMQAGAIPDAANTPGGLRSSTTLVLSIVGKWVLLFILAYIGSAIAGRGITLYQAARAPFIEEG